MGERAIRFGVIALALGVIAAAVLWVSVVRFKDEAAIWDCGVPIGAAWHGRQAPDFPLSVATETEVGHADTGLFGIPAGTPLTQTVCAGQARTRVAIAAGGILVAVGAIVVNERRRGRPQPSVAV